MKIAVLGTGMVGKTIATRLVDKGYQVMMGARRADNAEATGWADKMGENADHGTFRDAAEYSDGVVFNCTKGEYVMDVLASVTAEVLAGKILVDVSNPLEFSKGALRLFVCNEDSLAEWIQGTYPETFVVKALNTMNAGIMLNPSRVPGDHNVFMSGNDEKAKLQVREILKVCGWAGKNIIDLGDITTARGTEMLLPIWLRLWGALGTADFNFHIQRAG